MIGSIAGAAIALGSSIYGAIASAKKNEKARQLIQQQRDENRAWYNTRMSQDYTMRADAQAAINSQRRMLEESMKNIEGLSSVVGASEAAKAAQKSAANQAVAQTYSDVASEGAKYKDEVERTYRAEDAALNQQQASTYQQQAAETAQAASQAVNAGVNLIGLDRSSKSNVGTVDVAKPDLAKDSAVNSLKTAQSNLDSTIKKQVVGNPVQKITM